MVQEIERKFLVKGDFKTYAIEEKIIIQGYLSTIAKSTVRVRIYGDKGYITIKGKTNKTGLSRYEWEKEIPMADVIDLLKLCEDNKIEKTRFIVPANDDLVFEIDEFYGENKGLIIAEIELPNEDTIFTKPIWLGKEVTGISKYYNAMLVKNPFKKW